MSFLKVGLFLILVSLPLCLWLNQDHSIAPNDPAFYMEQAQENYLAYEHAPWSSWLKFTFFHRHYKPILHPVAASPLLVWLDGDLHKMTAIFNIGALLLMAFFLYKAARILVSEIPAMIATLLAVWNPWIFSAGMTFQGELLLAAFACGSLYNWLRFHVENSENALPLFLFFFGLSVLTRPLEAYAILTPLALFSLGSLVSAKKINLGAALSFLLETTLVLLALGLPVIILKRDYRVYEIAILLVAALLPVILRFKLKQKPLAYASFANFIILAFFIGNALDLGSWIYDCTVGPLVQRTGLNHGKAFSSTFWQNMSLFGILPWLLILSTLSLLLWKQLKDRKNFFLLSLLFATLFLWPLAGALSSSHDHRYYYTNLSLLLWCSALSWNLIRPYKISPFWINLGFAVGLIAGFLTQDLSWTKIAPLRPHREKLIEWYGRPFYATEPDSPHVLKEFIGELQKSVAPDAHIMYFWTSSIATEFINPWPMNIYSRSLKLGWTFSHPSSTNFSDLHEELKKMSEDYDYFLIGALEGATDGHTQKSSELLTLLKQDCPDLKKCSKRNLRFVKSLSVNIYNETFNYILLKTPKVSPPSGPDCLRTFKERL